VPAGEAVEQKASHHAEAGNILNSKDALPGRAVAGEPPVAVGCRQCDGSIVKTNPDGTLSPSPWPNTGLGRVSPDSWTGTTPSSPFSILASLKFFSVAKN